MVAIAEKKITVSELFEMELEDGFFYELINGMILKKQAPSPEHQNVSAEINDALRNFVKPTALGKVFYAPIDVFFDAENYTQPDLIFIKTERIDIITSHGIEGAPDLIVEIISPSSIKTDKKDKFKLYLKFGVKEYWLVDPKNKSIEVYSIENGNYEMQFIASGSGIIQSSVLEGFQVDVSTIFQ